MSSFKQFKSLFAYHVTANPTIWIFAVAFTPQALLGSFGRYNYNLEAANLSTFTLLWLPLLFASFLFGSQIFAGMYSTNMSTQLQIQAYNPEFILTRAVSRGNVFWARAAVYWSMILVPIVIWLVIAIKQPSFTLELRPERVPYYLGVLPGSFVDKVTNAGNSVLIAPLGGLWLKLWAIYLLLFAGTIAQLFISVITTLRWRNFYYWTGFAIGIIIVFSAPIFGRAYMEKLFLFAVNHAIPLVVGLIAVIAISQPISKRRFLDQEF
jgi:hypothetical protein